MTPRRRGSGPTHDLELVFDVGDPASGPAAPPPGYPNMPRGSPAHDPGGVPAPSRRDAPASSAIPALLRAIARAQARRDLAAIRASVEAPAVSLGDHPPPGPSTAPNSASASPPDTGPRHG